ncbi:MAG: tetratricopeptide repeat protein, partial [Planctomycetota bacterium]
MRRGARRRVPSLARSRVGLVCDLPGRLWQALGNSTKASDQALLADLTAALAREPGSADLSNALGVAAAMGSQAKGQAPIDYFHQAVQQDSNHLMAGLNLVEALVKAGQYQPAIDQALQVLTAIPGASEDSSPGHTLAVDSSSAGSASLRETPHFPTGFDFFR